MSNLDAVESAISQLNAVLKKQADEALAIMNEEVSKEMATVNDEFGPQQNAIITRLFNEAIDQFYESYSPKQYTRRYDLYDLLAIHYNDDTGLVDYDDVADLIDSDRMPLDRRGNNTLFESVFLEGYHGGATDIYHDEDIYGEHPSPGTPYWRSGMLRYSKKKGATIWVDNHRWLSAAYQSEAPLIIFAKKMQAAEKGEIYNEFKRISDEHNERAMAKVMQRLNK